MSVLHIVRVFEEIRRLTKCSRRRLQEIENRISPIIPSMTHTDILYILWPHGDGDQFHFGSKQIQFSIIGETSQKPANIRLVLQHKFHSSFNEYHVKWFIDTLAGYGQPYTGHTAAGWWYVPNAPKVLGRILCWATQHAVQGGTTLAGCDHGALAGYCIQVNTGNVYICTACTTTYRAQGNHTLGGNE